MSAGPDAYRQARLAARRLRSDVVVTLEAVKHAGGSTDSADLKQSIAMMGRAFILAGWKPRVRVPCGRRVWPT